MSKPTVAPAGEASEPAVHDRLDSWKEIASYLGREIRTVYRWEADEGLPVHRHLHKKRGTVYAYRTELDVWRKSRGSHLAVLPFTNLSGRSENYFSDGLLASSPKEGSQPTGELRGALAGALARHTQTRFAIAAAVTLAVAAVGATFWQGGHTGTLTNKDVLVLAEFTNSTGDPVFDVTLREALATQLEESPFLKIMDDDRVRDDLRLMARPAGEHITNQIAREICLREGNKAIIGGSIASLGKTYAIALQATSCETGETLVRQQAKAEDKEHVLGAVAVAATGIRVKLGESLSSIQKVSRRPEDQVSTVSLEAFQAYALGREQEARGEWLAAIPFYERATELDSNFAMAYLRAGERYGGVGEISRRSDYFTKAFALIEHVSERERLAISAGYYRFVTFDTDKAADIDQSHARAYPREGPPHNWLGIHYWDTGELGKAVQEFQEAIRLDPRDPVFYSNLVEAYSRVDRFDEAKAVAEKAFAQKLDAPPMHRRLLHMAYVQGDRAAQEKEIRWHAGKPQEYQSVALQAENAMTLGRRRQANELIRRGVELARRWNLPEVATRLLIQIPRADALTGNCEAARGRARVLIPPDPDARNAGEPATVLAFCGGLEQSQKLVNEVSQRFPNATYWNTVALPDITAASELSRGQPAKAVEILSTALSRRAMVDTYQFDVAAPNTLFSAGAMPRYLRGLAYLRLGKGTEAAADFQKILDHKGACWGMEYLVSYVGLARAAVLAGDTGKAKKAYEDFFVMWKDADPDIPILIEARKEYAALH